MTGKDARKVLSALGRKCFGDANNIQLEHDGAGGIWVLNPRGLAINTDEARWLAEYLDELADLVDAAQKEELDVK